MQNFSLKDCLFKTSIVVGALLSIFLIALSIKEFKSISYVGVTPTSYSNISAVGKSEIVVNADIATVSFTVLEEAKSVSDAQKKVTDKINLVLNGLKVAEVADKDIKTEGYNINPKYESETIACFKYPCPPSKSIISGYEVSQTISLKIRDTKKIGSILDLLGKSGVSYTSGLQFSIDNKDEIMEKAKIEAIKDARAKADKIAEALGVDIVRMISYTDSSAPYYPYASDMVSARYEKAGSETQVPTGEQKITSNVTVYYEVR